MKSRIRQEWSSVLLARPAFALLASTALMVVTTAPHALGSAQQQAPAQPSDASEIAVSPEPTQLETRDDGFAVSPVVGLVATENSDADAERVVREALTQAGVRVIRDSDGEDPGTRSTVWLGGSDETLRTLDVEPAGNMDAESYVFAAGTGQDNRTHIVLDGVDTDGTFYAAQSLRQLLQTRSGRAWMPGVEIRDIPTMTYRGSIEGFYGTPWTHEERLGHLDYLGAHKMNTYMYAPKDDPYHRERWDEPYPDDDLARLGGLVDRATANKVDFTFAISPGNSICYTDQSDVEKLMAKFDAMYDLGVRSFNIALDDIDYTTWHCDSDEEEYGSGPGAAGAAQAELLTHMQQEWVESKGDVAPLQMVPTEYYNVAESKYKTALREQMHSDVIMHWTGTAVVPAEITSAQAEQAREVFGHEILVWDNYPVNDYAHGRLLLAPYSGRETTLHDDVVGVLSNPMNQASVSELALYAFGEFTWNTPEYDADQIWRDAMAEQTDGNPDVVAALRVFSDLQWHDGRIHHDRAPQLATAIEEFNATWESGDHETAIAEITPVVDAIIAAPQTIREGIGGAFAAEADVWLEATELWGQAMRHSLALREALVADDLDAAWQARQQISTQREQALALRDGRLPHGDTNPKVADGVLDTFITEAETAHDDVLDLPDDALTDLEASTTMSVYGDNTEDRMADGNVDTHFWSDGPAQTDDEIRVDLGEVTTIGDIDVLMGKPDSPDDYIQAGALEISTDGQSWTELTTSTEPEVRYSPDPGAQARYVRYRATEDNDGSWVVVREFTVDDGDAPRFTADGAPEPAEGTSFADAVDGDLATTYQADEPTADGDAFVLTADEPVTLDGLLVLQESGSAAAAQAEVDGEWVDLGDIAGGHTELAFTPVTTESVRLVWRAGAEPAVAEVVPRTQER